MAKKKTKKIKTKLISITLEQDQGVFSTIWPFRGQGEVPELEGVQDIRHLLSNEKARILFIIKQKGPESIYALAKILSRDFKSVREDVKLLQKFGLISLQEEGKERKRLKPVLAIDELNISFKI